MIEKIKNVSISETNGFGEWGRDGKAKHSSIRDYVESLYKSKDFFDWRELFKIDFFDKNFTEELSGKISDRLKFLDGNPYLMHGDFGNDNVYIKEDVITGIIDWEKSRYGDHFLDVGRVVLFCPSREASVAATLSFYEDKEYENYKERILLGVYFAMLSNYAFAAIAGKKESCMQYPARIKQIENLLTP